MSSLAGRRVVVTRAAAQAASLVALLESRGARPVVMPLIDIVDEPAELDVLGTLLSASAPSNFDWIVFTSPNGAERGVRAGVAALPRDRPRIAVVGAATALALERVDLVATTQSALGLLDEFPLGTGDVLVVQAVDAQPTLADGLVAKGYTVTVVTPYRSVVAVPRAADQRAVLAADAVLFASGSAARAWVQVFGPSAPPIVVAIGPETAAATARAGLKVSLTAADHSPAGMVAVLETWFQQER